MAILRVLSVTFLYISPQPPFDLELDYISESQWNVDSNCILSAYCQLFTHESNTFTSFRPFKPMGTQMPKNPLNRHFPWGTWTPSNIMSGPPHSPHQTTARLLYAIPHNYATKAPLATTMGRPTFTPKLVFIYLRSPPHLIHPSLDRRHSLSQTASRSNQPFCHNTLCGPTDRSTDRWSRSVFRNINAPFAMMIESDALKTYRSRLYLS